MLPLLSLSHAHNRYLPALGRRCASTLLEVLVVVAIASLLAGLLLASVQAVRASAARAACLNQLRQIGLALQQYHDSRRAFPPGVVHPRVRAVQPWGPDTDPFPLMNWPARLLPYLEQEALWKQTVESYAQDPRRSDSNSRLHPASRVPVKIFQCPADSPRLRPNAPDRTPGMTAYAGVAGRTYPRNDGLLFMDSAVRLADVTDGTSNTLLVGERPPNVRYGLGRWYGGWGHWMTGDAYLGVRENFVKSSICHISPVPYQADRLDNDCSSFHFWSLHRGGAHFLFADGGVRFIAYTQASILPALATRAGGEPAVALD